MKKPSLLPLVESQISLWDAGLGERVIELVDDVFLTAETIKRPVEIERFRMPAEDMAEMAVSSLVPVTGYSADYFECVSDCLHMKSAASNTPSKDYVEKLLDVRASALALLQNLDDAVDLPKSGYADCAANEARELVIRIGSLNAVIESRRGLESDLHRAVKQTRRANQAKMEKARSERQPKYDWEAVAKMVSDLRAAGHSERDLSGLIQKRLGVPPSRYREWRKKQTPV